MESCFELAFLAYWLTIPVETSLCSTDQTKISILKATNTFPESTSIVLGIGLLLIRPTRRWGTVRVQRIDTYMDDRESLHVRSRLTK